MQPVEGTEAGIFFLRVGRKEQKAEPVDQSSAGNLRGRLGTRHTNRLICVCLHVRGHSYSQFLYFSSRIVNIGAAFDTRFSRIGKCAFSSWT